MKADDTALEVSFPECPKGIPDCGYLKELVTLRTEVDRLTAMALTDELTGLYNFRHFSQALEVEMERTRRSGDPTALMVIDLDNFKSLNDRHGHEFGNKVLSQVAGLLMRTIRKLDVACRYGGEEFTVVLPSTPLTSAVILAKRLCHLIADLRFGIGDEILRPTASFGVDVYLGDTGEDSAGFLARADSYLLQAKREGKNRVCHPAAPPSQGLSADERDVLQAICLTPGEPD